ncbi:MULTISPECIES: acetyltransferase [Terrisporobacter]|uniref:Acetyltransferase n=1 Tax=Terrisporobacter muris TaxID=2963284 RepID=A0A9X2MJ37_9FIRM|nr:MULTISPECIES: acetyltransferase [Terrisporobacter]MCC3671314.1 acetyltransferase [Terrisporobacter mayombei]MCR1824886.1 acetyltransferase [Terrisporobacter muris]MDY3372824.1 acetyltransferase [Terrisporobacter othiniensis]
MKIREYKSSDCNEVADLFYNTVHCIYTENQLNVWPTGNWKIEW